MGPERRADWLTALLLALGAALVLGVLGALVAALLHPS